MTDTARYIPVLIFASEFMGIGRRVRVRSSIGVPFQRDGWNANRRGLCQLLFGIIVFLLAFGKSKPPAVVMDDDGDMVGIVE